MCFYQDECATVTSVSVRKASKAHSCMGCGERIEPGEKYEHASWLFDGRWDDSKCCARCRFDTLRIVAKELNEGCRWSEAWCPPSELHEYLCETDQKLTPKAEVPEWFDLRQDSAVAVERLRKNPTSEAASP